MGDGLLVEFNSVVDAVRCAIEIQRAMPERGADVPADRRIRFRIAINMGDVVSDGDLIYGDGVAVASRMESLAEPGGINVSRAVRDQVRDRLPIIFEDFGEHEVKNIAARCASSASCWRKDRRARRAPAAAEPPRRRQAGARRVAVSEPRRRRRDGVLSRQRRRGSDHRAGAGAVVLDRRPQHQLQLQGKGCRFEADRARARRPLCGRGQPAQGRATGCASAASSSRRRAASICGPTASTAPSKTRSICRTGSPKASSARSRRCCARPRSSGRGASPRQARTFTT